MVPRNEREVRAITVWHHSSVETVVCGAVVVVEVSWIWVKVALPMCFPTNVPCRCRCGRRAEGIRLALAAVFTRVASVIIFLEVLQRASLVVLCAHCCCFWQWVQALGQTNKTKTTGLKFPLTTAMEHLNEIFVGKPSDEQVGTVLG